MSMYDKGRQRVNQTGHHQKSAQGLGTALYGLEIVYYVRHLGHIKIGTTMNLMNRLHGLGVGIEDVVAFEWGGRDLERQRHEQFAHLRATGDGLGVEHFRATPELTEHIDSLKALALSA